MSSLRVITVKGFTSLLLAVLLLGQSSLVIVSAQQTEFKKRTLPPNFQKIGSKLAPDLEVKVRESLADFTGEQLQRVIISISDQKTSEPKNIGMILSDLSDSEEIKGKIGNLNGHFEKDLKNLGMIVAKLPLNQISKLAEDPDITYISPDRAVASTGHIAYTSGAEISWVSTNNTNSTAHGTGVGVAILDSGIDPNHYLWTGSSGQNRIVYSKDFTGQNTTTDKFGHGTHVASLAAGGFHFGWDYNGIAPNANLINLRVLNEQGKGYSSNAVAAIDWAIANKSTYNIRVINMSLGTPPKDSYLNDPLCKAARRAYNAGILVVASAGNNGKDANGNKMYGYINSPGIEPSVLTVGAANTYGTTNRGDDTVTTFSSRGPTRGYTTINGVRNYDNLIKPDIVAPGNKLIGAKSAAQTSNSNSLVVKYPLLNVNNGADAKSGVMYLSGTSMATPMVAGTAAIMFQARPDLTPGLVKAILMYTAQPMKGANTLEQGAGLLNIKGATEVLNLLKPNAAYLTNGTTMLTGTLTNQYGTGQCSYIHYQSICDPWGKGIVTNFGFLYGDKLMTTKQGIYSNGVLISDGTIMSGNSLVRSSSLTVTGVNVYQGAIKINSNGVLISDGILFMASSAMGNDTLGNGVLISDGVLVSDGVLISDTNPRADTVIYGDDTACMQPE